MVGAVAGQGATARAGIVIALVVSSEGAGESSLAPFCAESRTAPTVHRAKSTTYVQEYAKTRTNAQICAILTLAAKGPSIIEEAHVLAEDRHAKIVEMVSENGSATVPDLAETLGISESTIRRDLEKLDAARKLVKVHGGATSVEKVHVTRDVDVAERYSLNISEKRLIAEYAASLISPDDFVYIDAGSTTDGLIDCLGEVRASYVTGSVSHALKLVSRGMRVVVIGGELKGVTEALVGPEALECLERLNFTIGFWGTNGISAERGLTTPDRSEAMVKRLSMARCDRRFVLADASKFDRIAPVTFADFTDATILTDYRPRAFEAFENIMEVGK